ncbi:MAG: S8 family serine peptidase, partial [Aridibacter sp.]
MNYLKQKTLFTQAMSLMLLFSMVFINVVGSATSVNAQSAATNKTAETPMLDRYTTNLTALASGGKLRISNQFDKDVERLIESLSSNNLRQPALLDQVGENQELVVEVLATRIAKGDVPANLQNKRILMLKAGDLFSTSKNETEVAQKIESIISELVAAKGNTILFVNELTNFVGSSQVNEKLSAAILINQVKIIGGSSKDAYNEKINTIAEVSAVFEPIVIGQSDEETAKEIAKDQKEYQKEKYRGDNVSSDIRNLMKQDPLGKKRLDVIIQAKDADNAELRKIMAENNVRFNSRIGKSDTIVVNLPLSAVEAIANSGLSNFMSPDRQMSSMGHLEKTTGATAVRTMGNGGNSLDGTGVGIAIVDSGMLVNHKAFKNRVTFSKDFTNENNPDDGYGHGTHVAGIAAGNDLKNNGQYRGIAPNANIINLKALNSQGVGNTSWLLNSLEWIKQNHAQYNIRVVNLSLGGIAVDTYTNDPVNLKVQELNGLG